MTSTSQPSASSSTPIAASPAPAIDSTRHLLHQWMSTCRQLTLELFQGLDRQTLCQQAHADFSPVGWHLGHIGYTEALWILEHSAGLPPQFPEYRHLFAANTLPKSDRGNLPTLAEIHAYLATIRSQVFDYLETAPLEQQERLWRWLLQHESQHCETVTLVLALLRRQAATPPPATATAGVMASSSVVPTPMLQIPAGVFDMGNESLDALDNEREKHQIHLDTYWIDRTPVTCGQYQQFMAADGYHNPQWWSEAGWQWVRSHAVTQPLYWSDDSTQTNHPVCGVSWYEAEAYANFVGKRLPTEAEWEKAARWKPASETSLTYPWGETEPTAAHCNCSHWVGQTTPVDAYAKGVSPLGCLDMLGNVWEWTASWFDRYPNFTAYPYTGYSEVYFDGNHRVLRGGSWATRPWALRSPLRNWYYPHMRELLVGFRCVGDQRPRSGLITDASFA